MKKTQILMLCAFIALLPASAAADELRGAVIDAATGEPVIGCIVKSKGAFTSTDKAGRFSLTLKVNADSVSFSSLGYESLTLTATDNMNPVRLSPKTTLLKDVIVRAPDIYARGDTLVFNVARYANASDNAIIDVIKRLPGIKVEEDGTIKYQGKPINKFYLDGNGFIGGQYGLATNNISYKDVASVEVMENHQPVKALEGIEFPEEAGINLKLKEDARSRWVGVAKGAAGVQPMLYDGSIFAMRIASKMQNMITMKADNTGWNPANEIKEHDFDGMFSSDYMETLWPEYISADLVSIPLSEKRTRDNLSWLANGIAAWKAGDSSIRLKLNYMGDRLDYRSGIITDYMSNQIPTFTQNNSQRTQSHDLSAQLYSETNKQSYYLKDKLTLSGVWNTSNSALTGSFDLVQKVNRRNLSALNDLKLVKRTERKLFTLISRTSLSHRPDLLLTEGSVNASQRLGTTDFRSSTETSFGRLTRFWKYYLNTGLDLDYHRMSGTLTGLGKFDNSGVHKAFISNLYATPQVDYERSGWRASLRVPLKWLHYSVTGQHDYISVYPRLNIRRQLTAKSELSASVAYSLGTPQPYLFLDMPLLSDYRNITIASNTGKYWQGAGSSLSYKYRNPLKAFFANLSTGYSYNRSRLMANQVFADDLIISTFADRLYHSNSWTLSGGVSKELGHSKLVIGCEANASTTSASSMRDFTVIPYRQLSVEVKPYLKGKILSWLSANYETEYEFSLLSFDGDRNDYHTFHQNLFVTLIPSYHVQFTVGAEHFLTRFSEGNTANLILLDASAVWKVSHKVRLSLTANNLLDRHRYEYVSYGTLSRSEHTFSIRPRSILAAVQYRF